MLTRLAIAVGVVLLAASAASFLIPSEASGYECGNAVAPEWREDETQELIDQSLETAESGFEIAPEIAADAAGVAVNARRAYDACSDSLSTRTTMGWSFLGAAVVIPGAVVFVARGRRAE